MQNINDGINKVKHCLIGLWESFCPVIRSYTYITKCSEERVKKVLARVRKTLLISHVRGTIYTDENEPSRASFKRPNKNLAKFLRRHMPTLLPVVSYFFVMLREEILC